MDGRGLCCGREGEHRVGGERTGVAGGRGAVVDAWSFPWPPRRSRLVVARICVAAGTMAATACGGGDRPPRGSGGTDGAFEVEAEILPGWRDTVAPHPVPRDSIDPAAPKRVVIYLDRSVPMSGFLPLGTASPQREESPGTNEFRAVAQWVPDHLTRVHPNAGLHWRGVGKDIRDLSDDPALRRELFDGGSSRIDLAIREALADLRYGRTEAAALITDLLGTGDLTGALTISRYLSDWLESEAVRSGELHLGLLGVRASYWGGTAPTCPPEAGLGCWYSERGRGWRRLEDVALAPFYVLVLGRGAEALTTILESIRGDAERLGIEAVSELLTANTRRPTVRMACTPSAADGEGEQYALRVEDDRRYACLRDDRVMLSCEFDGGFRPEDVRVGPTGGVVPEEFAARVAPESRRIEIGVDCEGLRSREALPDLILDVGGTVAGDGGIPDWDEWSVETDDLPVFPGKTLQLRYFIEEVRVAPDSYRAQLPPVLREASR